MNVLKKIGDGISFVNEKINDVACWLIYPLTGVVMYEVVRRYLLNNPTNWVYDMTWILYGIFVLLGGAYGLHRGVHVKADIIYNMLPQKGKIAFDIFSYLVFFFPVMIIMSYSTYVYFMKSLKIHEVSNYTSWGPALWPMKFVLCLSMVMMLFQGCVEFGHAISPLFTKKNKEEEIVEEIVEEIGEEAYK